MNLITILMILKLIIMIVVINRFLFIFVFYFIINPFIFFLHLIQQIKLFVENKNFLFFFFKIENYYVY